MTADHARLVAARTQNLPWNKWGPHLSERRWGTACEDDSQASDAWNYFTHDQAHSRAHRWAVVGIAGNSNAKQRLCFALKLTVNWLDCRVQQRLVANPKLHEAKA